MIKPIYKEGDVFTPGGDNTEYEVVAVKQDQLTIRPKANLDEEKPERVRSPKEAENAGK